MAKMMNRKERAMRKGVGSIARGILGALEAKEALTSPHTYVAKKALEKLAKADRVKMRRGPVRGKYQVYNDHINRWVKINSKTGKIEGVKKDGLPYKGIPKKKRGKKGKRRRKR